MRLHDWLIGIVAVAMVLGSNYLLALAGEPRAYWLMHTVLGWV